MKYAGGRWKITRAGTDAATTTITPDIGLRLGSFQQDFKEVSGQPTSDLTNSFTYNSANQVISLLQSNTDYNYTDANNRTGIYEPNGLNQYKKVDGQEFEHDATGNLKKDRASDGVLTTYSYDMENHLVRVEGPVAGDLTYDALGRLSRLVSGSNSTQFLYDGDALVAEYLNGALHRRYVHGDQVDEPLIEYQGANLSARRYLHADHQGSIIAHSNANGEVTQKNAYDPYGIPAPSNDGRFGYTGQSWLKELGLNYYKARIYSPRLGRFLQTDPIFYKDDMNLYAYVGNDPQTKNDPTGMFDTFSNCENAGGGKWVCGANTNENEKKSDSGTTSDANDLQLNSSSSSGGRGSMTPELKVRDFIIRGDFKGLKQYMETLEVSGETVSPQLHAAVERAVFRSELIGARISQEAAKRGFSQIVKDPPFNPHGQKVFSDGTRMLTRDWDSHSGGVWKMFSRSGERLGTYDQNLQWIAK